MLGCLLGAQHRDRRAAAARRVLAAHVICVRVTRITCVIYYIM